MKCLINKAEGFMFASILFMSFSLGAYAYELQKKHDKLEKDYNELMDENDRLRMLALANDDEN